MPNLVRIIKRSFVPLLLLTITACGGSGSSVSEPPVADNSPVTQSCETSDNANTSDGCGTVLLSLTDAEGDFLVYNVKVSGIQLTRIDGTQVSVMPTSDTVNFVDYVELSELVTAATIPAGIYTSGAITIDYTGADIQVEKDGVAVAANIVDEAGTPLITQTMQLQFDENNSLIVTRHRPALLEIDFNLAASHNVDLTTDPATVTTEPYLIAEIDPVDSKEFRVRGPLLSVNEAESYFRLAVRPFHRNDGHFGGVNVHVNDDTNFEIDDADYTGAAGLAAMATLAEGTPTVTLGVFNRGEDSFTAITVIAGSSVPGSDKDGARGVVVARDGNTLTVKGASLIRQDGQVTFNDEIRVLIADTTHVNKNRRMQDEVSIADISVGQAITVLGTIKEDDNGTLLDASEGTVRMRLTFASGHVLSQNDMQINMNLQALQERSPTVYDFSGTGVDETFDADPQDYEVSTLNMMLSNVTAGDPLRVAGYVMPFGTAPADFEALTVINYAESRSQLFVDWPEGDDVLAFTGISSESMTVNVIDGGIYKLRQGGIATDLASLESAVRIEPLFERGLYTLRTDDTVMAFSNFADFVSELQQKLDEGKVIDLMHGVGGFSTDSTTFKALKLHIRLN